MRVRGCTPCMAVEAIDKSRDWHERVQKYLALMIGLFLIICNNDSSHVNLLQHRLSVQCSNSVKMLRKHTHCNAFTVATAHMHTESACTHIL